MSEGRTGITGLLEDLEAQRKTVAGRCPPYLRALELLPAVLDGNGPLGRALAAAWDGRRFFATYDRPLLLLAALRADARADGPSHPLFEAFAAPAPRAEAVTVAALTAALDPGRDRVYDALIRRSVQTNETSRAIAWLWPAALAGASGGGRPIALADVGASAGLNLVGDALPTQWRFADGTPVEVARGVNAVARLGLDANPLDVTRAEDADWLRACVWPGETARLERLEAALRAFTAARVRLDAPVLVPILARNVPARLDLLSSTERGALVIAYQTVVRDYLAPDERADYETGMAEWLGTHPPGHALWVELEWSTPLEKLRSAGDHPAVGCGLVVHVRAPGGEVRHLELARCGYHPGELHPDHAAAEALRALLAVEPLSMHPPAAP